MTKKGLVENLKSIFKKMIKKKRPIQSDEVELILPGLIIRMKRNLDIKDPHEFTAVVPRAEFRKKINSNNKIIEYEVILSSITVVHAPRHPPGESYLP
jgi:hypothetical protein